MWEKCKFRGGTDARDSYTGYILVSIAIGQMWRGSDGCNNTCTANQSLSKRSHECRNQWMTQAQIYQVYLQIAPPSIKSIIHLSLWTEHSASGTQVSHLCQVSCQYYDILQSCLGLKYIGANWYVNKLGHSTDTCWIFLHFHDGW